MDLTLPTVSSTIGPQWATELNAAITTIDSHDHSSGKGTQVPVSGLNINANLSFGNNQLTSLGAATFTNLGANLTDLNAIYDKDGDLYFNDAAGNQVRLTSGGAVNVGSLGGIGGDYASTAASVYYTDSTKIYTFEDSTSANADITVGDITCDDVTAGGTGDFTGTLTVTGAATLSSTTTISGDTTVAGDANFTGNTTGRGIVPVGAILPLMSNLTGITDVTATTAADVNGYVTCAGQTIVDATSPLNGETIPNINNSVFLMGHGTAGTTGGANAITLIEANLPAHVHTIDHGHADTFALGSAAAAAPSHTHNMKHVHQWAHFDDDHAADQYHTLIAADNTAVTVDNTDSVFMRSTVDTNAGGASNFLEDQLGGTGDQDLYTAGVVDGNSGTGANALTGADDGSTTTVTLSGSVTSMTGNSGSVGSDTSFNNRPSYITAKHIMRIK